MGRNGISRRGGKKERTNERTNERKKERRKKKRGVAPMGGPLLHRGKMRRAPLRAGGAFVKQFLTLGRRYASQPVGRFIMDGRVHYVTAR